jgi:hypothetical protein
MADKKISALPAATTPLAGTEVLPIVQGGTTDQVSVANLTAGRAVSAAQLDVDNIRLDANTISTTNTNGNLTLDPNGSGYTIVAAATNSTIARMGDLNSRTFYVQQANVGGYDNDTLIFESDSGVGQFQWKNSGATLWSMNAAGNLVPATAGKGIDFSANGGDVLSQYDEGTWTPTGNGVTFSSASGKYTRIGNLVTCTFTAAFPITADTSTAYISGLPFTPSVAGGVALGGYASDLVYSVTSGNTFIQPTNAAGSAFKTNANLSGQTIIGTFSFQV